MKQRGWWRAVGMAVCALMIAAMALGGTGVNVAGQDAGSTPGPGTLVGQDGGQQPEVTPTPVVGSTSGQLRGQVAPTPVATEKLPTEPTGPTGPVASGTDGDSAAPVLAQGLVYLTGADVIWQVREVQLSGNETVNGNARVVLQRSGATVIRNDVTGKRTRLEPGEAFFAAAGDPYTTAPDGNQPSTVWIFEVSNSNQVGQGAFYLSPDVPGYGEAVYDFEFTRYVVPAGESVDFMGGDGPSLLVVLSGAVDVTLNSDVASLNTKDGLVVDGTAVMAATGGESVVVSLTLGPKVSDASAAAPQAQPTPATADSGDAENAGESGTATAAQAEPTGDGGAFETSIKVGAVESVGITMYVDGEVAFDGWLEAGEWTEFYTGSTFEVHTTSGANTMFQNTCSTEPFWMDYTPGETSYVLKAGPSSCAPAS